MRVLGFDKVNGYFESFSLKKIFGEHSVCKFRMNVRDDEVAALMNKVGEPLAVMLGVENPVPVFFGEIYEIALERTISRTCIEVVAFSDSKKTDAEAHTRLFQNPKKTFGEILNPTRLKLKNCRLNLPSELAAKKYEKILLQNQETDFEFIKRLANYCGTRLWVVDTRQGKAALTVGYCLEDSEHRLSPEDIFFCRTGRKKNLKTMQVVTKKYFSLGTTIYVGADTCKYLITALEIQQVHGTDEIFYELEGYKPKKFSFNPAPLEKTVKLKAHVKNSRDAENFGRIQVQVDSSDAEDEDTEKLWLPYRSPYSGKAGGIVFMPDDGDAVELIFSNDECFVGSTFRENKLQEECQKVGDKYIGNNSLQRIFWRENSLEILSSENKIFLDKDKIGLTVGENKLLVDKKSIVLQTPKNKIFMSEKGIEIQSDGALNINTCNDTTLETDKALNLKAKGSVQIKGKSLNAKADGGDVNIKGNNINLS
ncbi:MAG: hypothetical protein IKT98_07375 [Selenomonadaceae bacterium]|nr:hypothetical protein [Selenomonadaceae bacterium]